MLGPGRTLIFLISRHPLKVVWTVVACALAIYLKNSANFYPWLGPYAESTRGGGGREREENVYVFPLELKVENSNVVRRELERNASIQGFNHYFFDIDPNTSPLLIFASRQNATFPKSLIPLGLDLVGTDLFNQLWTLVWSGRNVETAIFLGGVLGMAYSLLKMFRNFRKIGSMFSLGCCAMLVTALDLLFALSVLAKFKVQIKPLLLLEFGPYFIMAVGFRKSYRLAKSIYIQRREKGDTVGLLCGVEECLPKLALEYLAEMSLFGLFSLSDVDGLREFSQLCFAMLLFDGIFLFTFFLGMVAFRIRLHAVRAEQHQHQHQSQSQNPESDGNASWMGWIKLLLTLILLSLYALNVLQALSLQNDLSTKIIPLLREKLGNHLKFVIMPLRVISNIADTNSKASISSPGAIDVLRDVLAKLLHVEDQTSLTTVLQVSLGLALPISLICNYLLLRILQKYRRIANRRDNRPIGMTKTPSISPDASDEQVLTLLRQGKITLYSLESTLRDEMRAIKIRRQYLCESFGLEAGNLSDMPLEGLDYGHVSRAHCENVIGFVPLPVGVAGPIIVDDVAYLIPLATTEGALVASVNRGMKAISYSGGTTTALLADGMSRGPVVSMNSLEEAVKLSRWISDNFWQLKQVFNGSSRYLYLEKVDVRVTGRLVYLRFVARCGDAMGMNMVSRATEYSLALLKHEFPLMKIVALSGNFCSDKKAAAINWIDGRGKSVVAETTISSAVLCNVLKTTSKRMVEINMAKNLVGSAIAGAMGGFNAHAANIVAAMFIALGQDPAQVVASSACLTFMEEQGEGDLYISVSLPSMEVGTVGGGTALAAQRAYLRMLQLDRQEEEGHRAARLARIIAAAVLAGEISLLASLTEGTLVKAHMDLNRPPKAITN